MQKVLNFKLGYMKEKESQGTKERREYSLNISMFQMLLKTFNFYNNPLMKSLLSSFV